MNDEKKWTRCDGLPRRAEHWSPREVVEGRGGVGALQRAEHWRLRPIGAQVVAVLCSLVLQAGAAEVPWSNLQHLVAAKP